MSGLGFTILPGEHPIVPIMIGDAAAAARMAERMLERGVYVVGFSYPVVPQGKARLRTQVSALAAKNFRGGGKACRGGRQSTAATGT